MGCKEDSKKITGIIWVQESYGCKRKFVKALQDGNQKYIDSLIKRGKAIYKKIDQ